MDTKEELYALIEGASDEELEEIYRLIKNFADSKARASQPEPRKGGRELMSALLEIQIDGPEDFSENFDLYLNGEKRVEENLP
jgi:hypothetical protein